MHDLYENLEQLCMTVEEEINEANTKIRNAGNKITSGDLDYIDKLTHTLKSIKTTMAMMDGGYSSDYNGNSYARRRDSRGRYSSRRSYERSYDGDMVSELRELMEETPNNQMRQKFQQFISEIERMR